MVKPVSTLIPVPSEEAEVAKQVAVVPDDLDLDKDGVLKAAKEMGMVTFRPETLVSCYTLGKALKKVGVLKIGRTMLYASMEHLKSGADQCEEALQTIEDQETRAAILPTKLGFAKELMAAANSFIRSAELDGNDDSDNKSRIKPFGAGQQAGPVVVAQNAVVTVNS